MRVNLYTSNFKLLLKCLFFVVCMAAVVFYAGEKYKEAAKHNVVNYFTKARYDEFYELEKNSLDMVFLGSSHSYCTFDPANFSDALSARSHQMGTPLQHMDTSYYALREILQYQKPKVLVLEVYWDMLDDAFEMKQANSFFEVLRNDVLYQEYVKKVFPLNEKVKYHIFAMRYQADYFAYEGNQLQKKVTEKFGYTIPKREEETNGIEEYRKYGYVYCNTVMPASEYEETNQFKNLDGKTVSFHKAQLSYLEKIVSLCQQENIELVFVTAPIANVSMEYIKNYDAIYNITANLADRYEIPYIDYNIVNQKEKLLINENFRDDAHLNDSGVKIVNVHFSQWLKENTDYFSGKN